MIKKIFFLRIESFILFIISVALTLFFKDNINFYYYILLFFFIDIIGYIPGRVFNIFKGDEVTHKAFYAIYNICHSLATITLISIAWLYYFEDYSFLALYVHLFLDRGILGNFLKSSKDTFKTPTIHLGD